MKVSSLFANVPLGPGKQSKKHEFFDVRLTRGFQNQQNEVKNENRIPFLAFLFNA